MKSPPYAKRWQHWADCLYAYSLLTVRPELREHIYFPGVIYVLSDMRDAWARCQEAYRDYAPIKNGGRDWWDERRTVPERGLDWNELYWRDGRLTCTTLLPHEASISSIDWNPLVRPFLRAVVVYDKRSKRRADELGAALAPLNFSIVQGIAADGARVLI